MKTYKKLRNMSAFVSFENESMTLVSYSTAVVQYNKNYLLIYDYPSITTKKYIRAFYDDYLCCDINYRYYKSIIDFARKNKNVYIFIDLINCVYITSNDRHAIHNEFEYIRFLQEEPNPIF